MLADSSSPPFCLVDARNSNRFCSTVSDQVSFPIQSSCASYEIPLLWHVIEQPAMDIIKNSTASTCDFMSLSNRGLSQALLVAPGGFLHAFYRGITNEWKPDFAEGTSQLDVCTFSEMATSF